MVARRKAKPSVQIVQVRARKAPQKRKQKGKRAAGAPRNMVLSDPRAAAWDKLLRDPCSAQIAHPCYAGMDSGYAIRTVDYYSPAVTGLPTSVQGADIACNAVFSFTPHNISTTTGFIYQNGAGAVNNAGVNGGFTNFITSSGGPVQRYRAIACCLKWLPSGQYSKRSGIVSLGYSPGVEITSTSTSVTARPLCQHYSPNGSEMHEVRWLPTATDENFTSVAAADNGTAGTVFAVLSGVDGVYNSTTAADISGQFEVTTVWEWTPSTTLSVSVSPSAPLPYTSQQVLGTIGDLGAYIFHGVRAAGGAFGAGVMQGAARGAAQLLTGGVGAYGTRGNAMIRA